MSRHQHYTPPAPSAPSLFDTEQRDEITRVTSVIGNTILRFLRVRLAAGHVEFHADDLRRYIAEHLTEATAPASADRILRELRQRGRCAYEVVNRHQSLYRIVSVT